MGEFPNKTQNMKVRKPLTLIYLSVGLSLAATSQSTTVTITANKDADVRFGQGNNNVNFGNIVELSAQKQNGSSRSRALLDFDLSSLPANICISEARLSLYVDPATSPSFLGTHHLYIRRLTSAWSDQTVTWANQPTSDLVNSVGIASSTNPADYQNINVTQMIRDRFYNGNVNHGMLIRLQQETGVKAAIFCSSDHPQAALRPKLEITYTMSPGYGIHMVGDVCSNTGAATLNASGGISCGPIATDYWTYESNPTVLGSGLTLSNVTNPGTYHYTIEYSSGLTFSTSYTVEPCCHQMGTTFITLSEGVYSNQAYVYGPAITNTGVSSVVGDFLSILSNNPTIKDIYVDGSIALAGYFGDPGYANTDPIVLDGYNFYVNGDCDPESVNTQIRFVTCDVELTNCTFQSVNCDCMWEGIQIWDDGVVPGESGAYTFTECTFSDAEKALHLRSLGNLTVHSNHSTFWNNYESVIATKHTYYQTYYNIKFANNDFDSDNLSMRAPHGGEYSHKHFNFETGVSTSGAGLGVPLPWSHPAELTSNEFKHAEYAIYSKDLLTVNPSSLNEPIGLHAILQSNTFIDFMQAAVFCEPSEHKPSSIQFKENNFYFSEPANGYNITTQYGVYADHDLSFYNDNFHGTYDLNSPTTFIGINHETPFNSNADNGDISVQDCYFSALQTAINLMPTGFVDGSNVPITKNVINIRSNTFTDNNSSIRFRENSSFLSYLTSQFGTATFSSSASDIQIHCNEFVRNSSWQTSTIFSAILVDDDCWIGDIGNCSKEPGGNEIIGDEMIMRSIWNQGNNTLHYAMYDNENLISHPYQNVDYVNCAYNATDQTCVGTEGILKKENNKSQTALDGDWIFPNPTQDHVTILMKDLHNLKTIQILQIDGKVISTFSATGNQTTIDLTGYAKGVYVVKINDNHTVRSKQLIIE